MSRLTRGITLLLAALAVACSSDTPTGPQPGTLSVKLQNPNTGFDGAILFTLNGPTPVTNVVAVPGDTVWTTDFSGTVTKVIMTGALTNGVILQFDVPDVTVANQYLININQVAASANYSLRPLTSYVAFVSR